MRAIDMLRRSLTPALKEVHNDRVLTLLFTVECLLRGGRLSLSALGRAAPGTVAPKHQIKRVDRFLGNPRLHDELLLYFRAVIAALIPPQTRPVLLVDWTELGPQTCALCAALPAWGRALPLYVEVHSKQLWGNPWIERSFLATLQALMPSPCRPVVVLDGGFHSPTWEAVVELGWGVLTRLGGAATVQPTPEQGWVSIDTLYAQATCTPNDLGVVPVLRTHPTRYRLVLVRAEPKPPRPPGQKKTLRSHAQKQARKRAQDPWLLLTTETEASVSWIVHTYALRMGIEQTFRDEKNHRFGWSMEEARSSIEKRLEVLLLIAALGMMALMLLGYVAEWQGGAHRYTSTSLRRRRVVSLFVLGKWLIERREAEGIPRRNLLFALQALRGSVPSG